ncbi:MAG: DUF3500 domain-containing protein [Planctomycetota bacterium]
MNRRFRLIFIGSLAVVLLGVVAYAQRRGPRGGGQASLSQPFRGVAAGGKIESGLFKIESTGVSTKPVVDAATAFLAGLSEQQRERTTFPVDDVEWRSWDNRHFYQRRGVGFDEMTSQQRDLAFALMDASLSAKGLKLSKDIMKLNGTLAELANNFDEYGQWLYWVTIMGTPSETEPWGWQVDGHHLIINYFVLGDQVVMSPVFIGSEPVRADGGKFKGTVVMQDQQDLGLAFMQSLTQQQQVQATLAEVKSGNNALAQAYKDNLDLDYAGLRCSELTPTQKESLLGLAESYIGTMRPEHAEIKMAEVKDHLDRTYFAWIGDTQADSVFYYRIHSPVVLIEFDHQRRVAPFRSSQPTRDHIHAVLRTPNGNDYGKDLLRQHIQHAHSHN